VAQPTSSIAAPADNGGRSQARGRGRGDSSRGGRGGVTPSRPPLQEMTASGPFAMGPSQAGSSAWRTGPRVSAASIAPGGSPADRAALGANLTKTAAPTLKKEGAERGARVDDDEAEVYSDPDEGVEIVDMRNVHMMDWMAPENLKWETHERTKKKVAKVKREEEGPAPSKGKGAHSCSSGPCTRSVEFYLDTKAKEDLMEIEGSPAAGDAADINLANALDLSESEEEEEKDDIIDDFSQIGQVVRCAFQSLG
jgi:DNA-directed RNA polymerase III subunit RPC4